MFEQKISLGNFAPQFRWGGDLNNYTKDFVVGISGLLVNMTIDWLVRSGMQGTSAKLTKTDIAVEFTKLCATTGIGTAGGLVIALGEMFYTLSDDNLPAPIPLAKLAAYMLTVLFAQGKLTH